MSRQQFDLERVLAPVEASTFFSDYWEQRPLVVVRGAPDYYRDLLSVGDVEHLIESARLCHPEIRLVKQHAIYPAQDYTLEDGAADTGKVWAEFQNGATIVLPFLNRLWEPLAGLRRHLERCFHREVWTNIYYTPPASQGFLPHYDTHDVFVLQLAGAKHWRIYDAPLPLPLQSQEYDPALLRDAQLLHEFTLNPGDLIFLPHGFIHEALTSDSSSLHVTVGVDVYTWLDLLVETLESCGEQAVAFRQSLPVVPVGQDGSSARRQQLHQLLSRFAESTALEEAIKGNGAGGMRARRAAPDVEINPHTLERLALSSILRKRPGLRADIVPGSDGVALRYGGKQLKMPAYVEPALRYMLDGDEFEVASIPGNLRDTARVVLARRLLREGFLTVVRY